MRPTDINLPGAVDLSALRARAQSPAAAAGEQPGDGAVVIDVTEASFPADVVERSRQVPVVLDFWASWCGPCRQLSPVLEKLAAEGGGSWVLAKIDCDANPRLAQAAQVQGIPAVKAVVDGAVVSEFTGALPEAQVRQWLEQVLAFAAGRTGEAAGVPGAEDDPGYDAAEAALERGDYPAAAEAFRGVVERNPADANAKAGLAQAELLVRTAGLDEPEVRRRAQTGDPEAALQAADLEILAGRPAEAFRALVALVRTSTGEQRERVRAHLISLFDLFDPAEPAVVAARRDLASALF